MNTESQSWAMRLLGAAKVWLGVSFAVAFVLAGLLAWANPGISGVDALLELGLACLWVSMALNLLLVATLVPLATAMVKAIGSHQRERILLPALVAANLIWCLWVRFPMPHQPLSQRPFLTYAGIAENALLVVALGGLTLAGMASRSGRSRWLGLGAAVVAVTLCWASNAAREGQHRTFPPEAILELATPPSGDPPASAQLPGDEPMVFMLCLDGLSWSVLMPLLAEGALPNFSSLIGRGAIGYLDNGDLSYSPEIWASVFTGRSADAHGVYSFRKLRLPRSGSEIRDQLILHPTIDTFYDVHRLFESLPSLGLWSNELVSSRDRRVPSVWEIASGLGKKVVVVNPIQGAPVTAVNGAMISFHKGETHLAHPPPIAEMVPTIQPDGYGEDERSFESWADRAAAEARMTQTLVQRVRPDLVVFFTNFIDQISHKNWHFYEAGFLLRDLPSDLSDEGWANFVSANRDHRVFRVYTEMDSLLGEFVRAHPEATFVISSDHGWTYSGYEHFGSPPGVLILSGPGIRRGVGLDAPTILDVAPTVLALLGLPLSRELEGRVLLDALSEEPTLGSIASYGPPPSAPERALGETLAREDAELERLRELGYVN